MTVVMRCMRGRRGSWTVLTDDLALSSRLCPRYTRPMLSDRAKHEFYVLASRAGDQGMRMVNSFSGADKSDSEIYFCAARAYRLMAQGLPFADAVALQDIEFRKGAKEIADRIAAAPRTNLGPYSGQSSMHHRYVAPDAFERHALQTMKFEADRAAQLEGDAPYPLPGSPAAIALREASQAQDRLAQQDRETIVAALAAKTARKDAARLKSGKPPTFAEARIALMNALRAAGWTVQSGLKVPHATSPGGGHVRLWFKPQAIYAAVGTDFGSAHSWSSDIRTLNPERFAATVEADVLRSKSRSREKGY